MTMNVAHAEATVMKYEKIQFSTQTPRQRNHISESWALEAPFFSRTARKYGESVTVGSISSFYHSHPTCIPAH